MTHRLTSREDKTTPLNRSPPSVLQAFDLVLLPGKKRGEEGKSLAILSSGSFFGETE